MRTLSLVFGLALIAGCNKGDSETPEPEPWWSTGAPSTGGIGDSGGPVPQPDLVDKDGGFFLRDRLPGVTTDGFTEGWAAFGEDRQGMLDFPGCAYWGYPCVSSLPADDASATDEVDGDALFTGFGLIDGAPITVSGDDLTQLNGFNDPLFAGVMSGFGTSGDLAFDGDLAPYVDTGVFGYPDALEVTAPDVTTGLRVGPGASIDLAWTAGGAGEVLLSDDTTLWHLADDGSHSVPVADLDFVGDPFESQDLILSRTVLTELDAAGNDIAVQASSEQVIRVDYVDPPVGWTEALQGQLLATDCAGAAGLPSLQPGDYYGALYDAAADHDPGAQNPLTYYPQAGPEAVARISLGAGDALTVRYTLIAGDAGLYLLDDTCDLAAGLVGADDTVDGEEEVIDYTAPAAMDVFIVLDSYYATPSLFTMQVTRTAAP